MNYLQPSWELDLRCNRSSTNGTLPNSVKNIVLLEGMTKVLSELGNSENNSRSKAFEASQDDGPDPEEKPGNGPRVCLDQVLTWSGKHLLREKSIALGSSNMLAKDNVFLGFHLLR